MNVSGLPMEFWALMAAGIYLLILASLVKTHTLSQAIVWKILPTAIGAFTLWIAAVIYMGAQ